MREAFFNERGIRALADSLCAACPTFDRRGFVAAVMKRLAPLGLNERNFLVRDQLRAFLPQDYPAAIAILLKALGPESGESLTMMSVNAYVAEFGQEHPELSLRALKEITKRFSSEFAIRPFLLRHERLTLETLRAWAADPHPHVRRLVSEGTRPRLPWGMRLRPFVKNPAPVMELLELLKSDDALFVRRSVANNLNDIAKDNPRAVIATLRRWSRLRDPGTRWIVKHALRTLLKQGHPEALELLGYSSEAAVHAVGLAVTPRRLRIGGSITIAFKLKSKDARPQAVMVDYVVHHRKKNGTLSQKVFKLTKRTVAAGETLAIRKSHSFRVIGIRPYYPGEHVVEIQLNGRKAARQSFDLFPTG